MVRCDEGGGPRVFSVVPMRSRGSRARPRSCSWPATEGRQTSRACSGDEAVHPTDRVLGDRLSRAPGGVTEAVSAACCGCTVPRTEIRGAPPWDRTTSRLREPCWLPVSVVRRRDAPGTSSRTPGAALRRLCPGSPGWGRWRGNRHLQGSWFSSASWRAYSGREEKGTRGRQGCIYCVFAGLRMRRPRRSFEGHGGSTQPIRC